MVSDADFLVALRRERLMPILRADEPDRVLEVARRLADSGFRALEVSLTTPDAPALIGELTRTLQGVMVGAGTVLDPTQVEVVAEVDAQFVVTPALTDAVETATVLGLPSLVGAFTATEVVTAVRSGATAVKLFPADLGGPAYLTALRAPLPDVAFVPVGGVSVESGREYLARGAVALGLGSPLVGDAASGGSLDALAERAARFRALVEEGHPG